MKTTYLKILLILLITFYSCKSQHQNLGDKSLFGKYVGNGESKATIELILSDNNKFKFWAKIYSHGFDYTEGIWEKRKDTLILNSKFLNEKEGLNYALSSANWIEFKNHEWRIKSNQLIRIPDKKWKMKKITD